MVKKLLHMIPILHSLNTYFLNISESLGLSAPDDNNRFSLDEMVTSAIEKCRNHPGINAINTSMQQATRREV